jgi:hypothetical protein
MMSTLVCLLGVVMAGFALIWAPISLMCLRPVVNVMLRRSVPWDDAVIGFVLFSGGWASIIYVVRNWTGQCF